ncbi:MAG: serine/threonine protein kinase [Proteobacteria bacterium]|nr:serine/threonine protein kinase [Pseudomonadota bacterium]
MQLCTHCGSEYADEVSFCLRDGARLGGQPAPPGADALGVGSVLVGQLELREACGSGAMGTVFRAWQSQMEREVAVKLLRRELLATPGLVRRFYREARAAARLSHPNIVVVHAIGETTQRLPFIVMEYVAGESLARLCQQQGALPVARALAIARQIASALVEAHGHEIVHRDLKPANILLQRRGSGGDCVKVVDFGIAKIVCDGDESQLTQTGAIFGTPHYLAPEQAAGADVDARADLYALGVILFLMLTGSLPFPNPNGMEVLLQHLQQPPPRPRDLAPHLSAELEALVLRALCKERAQRWPTAAALHDALLALETGGATAAAPAAPRAIPALAPSPTDPRRITLRRSTWGASLVLAAALGVTVGALAIRVIGRTALAPATSRTARAAPPLETTAAAALPPAPGAPDGVGGPDERRVGAEDAHRLGTPAPAPQPAASSPQTGHPPAPGARRRHPRTAPPAALARAARGSARSAALAAVLPTTPPAVPPPLPRPALPTALPTALPSAPDAGGPRSAPPLTVGPLGPDPAGTAPPPPVEPVIDPPPQTSPGAAEAADDEAQRF